MIQGVFCYCMRRALVVIEDKASTACTRIRMLYGSQWTHVSVFRSDNKGISLKTKGFKLTSTGIECIEREVMISGNVIH